MREVKQREGVIENERKKNKLVQNLLTIFGFFSLKFLSVEAQLNCELDFTLRLSAEMPTQFLNSCKLLQI